jgi:hypothetical protein
MKRICPFLIFVLFTVSCSAVQGQGLLLDDFEGTISGGPEGTVDFGAGGGSLVEVAADTKTKNSGNQSLKITFDAVSGGYMWIAKGFGLDAKNSGWLVKPADINWQEFNALAFYMFGSDSKAKIAFDIKDNGNELWRFMIEDNFKGWKKIICPFNEFFARGDWQPDNADKNANLDFPIKSFQFEPRPVAKGTLYFDGVELVKK